MCPGFTLLHVFAPPSSPRTEAIEEKSEHTTCSLSDVLEEHFARYISQVEAGQEQLIPIRRQQLWKDVLRCISAPTFVHDYGLRVQFVGEEAVDAGGPLR